MSCQCVKTAILKENENEKLRLKIHRLTNIVDEYRQELYNIYSDSDSQFSSMSSTEKSFRSTYDINGVKKELRAPRQAVKRKKRNIRKTLYGLINRVLQ